MKNQEKKSITTIYILDIVKEFCKKNKLNLSEEINSLFVEKYLSIKSKVDKLELIKEEERLITEIKQIKERHEVISKNLTTEEKRYISQVNERIRKGFELKSIHSWFNKEFNRAIDLTEFKELVHFYEEQSQKRVEIALNKGKGIRRSKWRWKLVEDVANHS